MWPHMPFQIRVSKVQRHECVPHEPYRCLQSREEQGGHITLDALWWSNQKGMMCPPPPLYKLRNPNEYGPYTYCSLDKAVDTQVQK